MINALFIVWRECFEAVLIVGILYSYLIRQQNPKRSLTFMWGGVAAGAVLSALIALGVQKAQTELQGAALEYFEAGMLFTAAVLMAQMCIWMKKHARTIKSELEGGLKEALSTAKLVGVATITAFAIAREGFEIIMFFYGMSIEASEKGATGSLIGWSLGGVALTAVTWWAYNRGLKLFNPKVFFQVTAVFLLVTASSFVLASLRKLIQMDAIPTLKDQIWDTSWLLDERTGFGQIVNTITGYESTPALITVLAYGAFWTVTLFFYFGINSRTERAVPQTQAIRSS